MQSFICQTFTLLPCIFFTRDFSNHRGHDEQDLMVVQVVLGATSAYCSLRSASGKEKVPEKQGQMLTNILTLE